jgi:hypothetical protein
LRYLIDSVVLIDHFNGRAEATAFLSDNLAESAVSVVTRAEVLAGLDDAAARTASLFLDRFATLGIDKGTADEAARLRRSSRWKLPDAFQAAVARLHGLKLVTRNTRDFSPARHAFVLVPYR